MSRKTNNELCSLPYISGKFCTPVSTVCSGAVVLMYQNCAREKISPWVVSTLGLQTLMSVVPPTLPTYW